MVHVKMKGSHLQRDYRDAWSRFIDAVDKSSQNFTCGSAIFVFKL